MRFRWWPTVLVVEWDSNIANSCCVIEKMQIF